MTLKRPEDLGKFWTLVVRIKYRRRAQFATLDTDRKQGTRVCH